jgi:hypothetical protein
MFGDISPKLPGAQNALRGTSVTSVDGQTGAVNLTSDFDAAGTAAGLLGSLTSGAVWIPVSGAPSSGVGINGDYAWDPVAGYVYGPKASGAWPAGVQLSLPSYTGAPLTSGEATFLRETLSGAAALTSGELLLSYWFAVKSESSVAVTILSNSTASSGLTYAAIGLYSVSTGTGELTLEASTPSTTTLCGTEYTLYKTDFSTPYSRTAGNEYAIGVLMTGSTMPSLTAAPGDTNANSIPPRVSGALSGQSSLPSSIADSSLSDTYLRFFATVTPS